MVNENLLPSTAMSDATALETSHNPDLDSLKRVRATIKGKITRLSSWINSITPQDEVCQEDVEVRLSNLVECYKEFDSIQTRIESLCTDPEQGDVQRSRLEEQYFFTKATFTKFLRTFTSNNTPEVISPPQSLNEHNFSQNNMFSNTSHRDETPNPPIAPLNVPEVRLPAVNLPTFSGQIDHYRAFSELFKTMIDEAPQLSDVTRFYYLRSSLKGDALNAISNLPAISQNYKIAWQILDERYLCISSTVDRLNLQLLQLPVVSSENAQLLRNLLDNALKIIRSLTSLNTVHPQGESIFVSIINSKMDSESRKLFKMSSPDANILPTISDLQKFLSKRIQVLESLVTGRKEGCRTASHQAVTEPNHYQASGSNRTKLTAGHLGQNSNSFVRRNTKNNNVDRTHRTTPFSCVLCKDPSHSLMRCKAYLQKPLEDRLQFIKDNTLCFNCLSPTHLLPRCGSRFLCRICNKPHSTTICRSATVPSDNEQQATTSANHSTYDTVSMFNHQDHMSQVLLGTVSLIIYDTDDRPFICRGLLDGGSMNNLMTRELANKLRLKSIPSCLRISGIGNSQNLSSERVYAKIKSRAYNFKQNLEFLTLNTITTNLPTSFVDITNWQIPENIELADNQFNCPGKIDLIIGADSFYKSLLKGRIPANSYRPSLCQTRFGYIFVGKIPHSKSYNDCKVHLSLSQHVENFWKLDQCSPAPLLTPDELACETHFSTTHTRDAMGRFSVSLPFKRDPRTLGFSRSQARRRWLAVEQRLSRDNALRESYHDFMNTYLNLGHMTCLGSESAVSEKLGEYYIPHHPVIKPDSSSTRTRVVFDASARTSNGISLNNILRTGPTIQDELFEILLRFRLHNYVFTGDIVKMYRQILVAEPDRSQQLILYRSDSSESLDVYRLNTITYGMSCSPFLATRCLKQLFLDECQNFPIAFEAVNDFYVDDLITRHDNLEHAVLIQSQMIEMLARGGFPIKKFAANHPRLLENIPTENREILTSLNLISSETVKTLGLIWVPNDDIFIYDASKIIKTPASTKRQVLSKIASLYDPPGLIAPIVCQAKLFMKDLWLQKLRWDDKLPVAFANNWAVFIESLSRLNQIKVPRHAANTRAETSELHGFADASERAYGAVIYLRTTSSVNQPVIRLIWSKSRVAPQKQLSIPRLELCAALLLARLVTTVTKALNIPSLSTYCYTDSKITLAWLVSPPYTLKTFVANRVAEIQEYSTKWNHVPSAQNPADLLSRSCTVDYLKSSQLWWTGPDFLKGDVGFWTDSAVKIDLSEVPERKKPKIITAIATIPDDILFSTYSSLHKLVNIASWCIRFSYNTRNPSNKLITPLSVIERNHALHQLILLAQRNTFAVELHSLSTKGYVSKKSKLRQLSPFVDPTGMLRVGGRLKNTQLSNDTKHPIILATHHALTKLIIIQEHLRSLHGGPQLVLTNLRQKYWLINGKNAIRKIIHNCIPCFRNKPFHTVPIMGQLPAIRTEHIRPFYNTGVDFAGPFLLRPPTRSNIKLKYYVAIFVCMSTRATHIELVGALTAESFLATLKRFISRRGLCRSLSSDNATNFVGTRNLLRELYSFLRQNSSVISEYLARLNIQWHFTPALSPHYGGIWEAAVKSMKYHLRRVAGLALLNYEEFSTILCSIEACLNSRPLTPLSSDPSDFQALTPGHFLIGTSLLALPEVDHLEQPISRLTRWHRVQAITQHFWDRWSREFITSLAPLTKWNEDTTPLAINRLVLIKDDHLPPLQWKLGRITEIHPGKDGKVRVITIRTASGTITRNAHRVFPLPME